MAKPRILIVDTTEDRRTADELVAVLAEAGAEVRLVTPSPRSGIVRPSLAWLGPYLKFKPDLIVFTQLRRYPALLVPALRRKALGLRDSQAGTASALRGLYRWIGNRIACPLENGGNESVIDIHGAAEADALLWDGEGAKETGRQPLRPATREHCRDRSAAAIFSLMGGAVHARLSYPVNICLSTSVLCQARCIFCPSDRGKRINPKLMPFELFCRIIENARLDRFPGTFVFGENGEPLLHPEFPAMLSFLRQHFPRNHIVMFSNMERMDQKLAEAVLQADVGEIHFNYDGASSETYGYVKKLDFERVTGNIRRFFELRNSSGFKTRVVLQILSARRYLSAVGDADREKFPDDSHEAEQVWKPYLRDDDTVSLTPVINWAVDQKGRKPKVTPCKMLSRIGKNIYIAPGGEAYLCCLDTNADLIYGDLSTQSIREVWNSAKRREYISDLESRRFREIGYPCSICAD